MSERWPTLLMRVTFALAIVCLVIGGLVAVGNLARDSLGPTDRYRVDFMAIECNTPPNMSREDFLGEVQYTGRFPDDISILNPTLADQLRTAFLRHRLVADVKKITLLPPKKIIVELTFRNKPE